MGLYSGGLIIGRIFASEIWGAYFPEGLFFIYFFIYLFIYIYIFICLFIYLFYFIFFFWGGGIIIGILRYVKRALGGGGCCFVVNTLLKSLFTTFRHIQTAIAKLRETVTNNFLEQQTKMIVSLH